VGRFAIEYEAGDDRTMSDPDYPDQYWHLLIALPGPKKEVRQSIRNDLTFTELKRE
jgi:hypothetical protein